MGNVRSFVAGHKVIASVVAGAVVVGGVGVGVAVATADTTTTAVVTKVVDGDTIDVDYDGATHRVRLLNVDTPESVDPSKPVECLAREATDFLGGLLMNGTEVRLEFDEERLDQYDRELAGVFVEETLVNAEIARAGLGIAVLYEPNDRFYEDVRQAQEEAQRGAVGLYDPDVSCTLSAQLKAYEESVAELEEDAAAIATDDVDALRRHDASAAALVASGLALSKLFDSDRTALPLAAFRGTDVDRMRAAVTDGQDKAQTVADNAKAAVQEQERLAEERRVAEEAARKAAEEAERMAAEEAARKAAEDAARAAAAAPSRPSSPAPAPAPQPKPAPANVYYKNCAAARAAGAAPVYRGEPGYAPHLDRDGDGVGCE
ncbi:thermonuclease family protein [Georgenia ruanii]|uniref:thermonuclease family protein n=1 Tax=Georgenia ruanii TaxID=348442 RepID=UPI00126575EA|nr:thermonuclease family protein [Georgenia ruanii]